MSKRKSKHEYKYKNLCDCQIQKIERNALYEIRGGTATIQKLEEAKALEKEKAGNYYGRIECYQSAALRINSAAQILIDIINERGFSEDKK